MLDVKVKKNPTASEMGKLGGRARARKLSKKRRKEIAKKAAEARWNDAEHNKSRQEGRVVGSSQRGR